MLAPSKKKEERGRKIGEEKEGKFSSSLSTVARERCGGTLYVLFSRTMGSLEGSGNTTSTPVMAAEELSSSSLLRSHEM